MYFEPTESFAYPMMVYSNVSEGEVLTFRYFEAEKDQLYPCEGTLIFYEDMIEANAFESFELHVKSTMGVEDAFDLKNLSLDVYPNPFEDILHIDYTVVVRSKVQLTVFDMLGKAVDILHEHTLDPGSYSIQWNAVPYPDGTYFLELKTEDSSVMRKIVLIK